MNRVIAVFAVVAVVVAVLAARSVTTLATGPFGDEATIMALETRVAELETEVAILAAGAGSATSTRSSSEESSQTHTSTLFGEAPELPVGVDGELAVVAVGGVVRSTIPIVLRNNTGEEIVITDVFATGRDEDGTLAASAQVSSIVPYRVPSGGIAVGAVYFGADDLPVGLTFEFDPQYESADSDDGYFLDMAVVEAELSPSGIIGRVSNPAAQEVSGPFSVDGICFTADGAVAGYFATYAAKSELGPGEVSPFDASFYYPGAGISTSLDASDTCAFFVIGARGYSGV